MDFDDTDGWFASLTTVLVTNTQIFLKSEPAFCKTEPPKTFHNWQLQDAGDDKTDKESTSQKPDQKSKDGKDKGKDKGK